VTDGNDADPIAAVVDRDGEPVVEVVGEVDLSTAGQVEQAINELAARGGRVVDVSGVAFLDSSGVTALLRSVQRGHAFVLRNPSPAVTEVLAMAGLADTLPIEG
jgi:anti-anti-sigma factor